MTTPCLCPRPTEGLEQVLSRLRANPKQHPIVKVMTELVERDIGIAIRDRDYSCPICLGLIPAGL